MTKDRTEWIYYWQVIGQPWRTEPEIDTVRQEYLAQRRAIVPSIEQSIYPFKEIKLSRADVEWLLATHENGYGPVDWNDGGLRERQGLDLRGADLRNVNLSRLPLTGLYGALGWEEWLSSTPEQREEAVTCFEGADLSFTHLERTVLRGTHLEKAILYSAHLEGSYLYKAHFEGANLKRAFFDSSTQLGKAVFANNKFGAASFADVQWNSVNLTGVNWELLKELGEEQKVGYPKKQDRKISNIENQLNEYHRAVRANRQLAVVLQSQGLNEEAARFAYRARKLQRIFLHQQGRIGQYLFSLFLDLLTGYGYKPMRSFIAYLLVIGLFMVIYHLFSPQLLWNEALVISMTAFHGRGFFPGTFSPSDPLALIAAFEAFTGLIIEVTFIATLTQRLFRK
jgi:hypothetical protein